jgi:cyclase
MHLPGHTPYQLAVYVPQEKTVFTSDNVVNPGPPWLHQAVPYGWLDSLKRIQELDADVIVPGHGAVTDKSYLPKMSATIQNWINIVSGAIKRGLSAEEAQDKLTDEDLFPGMPANERLTMIKRGNIAHLYEVLKK